MVRRSVMFGLALCCTFAAASADVQSGDEAIDMAALAKMAKGGGGDKPDTDKGPFPPFDKITKDMQSHKGLFTLWDYPDGAKGKKREKLLCQIPAGFLGEKFMLSVSFSGGGFFTGFPLEERVVRWEVLDEKLLLVEPETRFVVDKKNTVNDVVRRTYPERIRVAVPIVTKSPQGDPVIDLGRMLKSNFADIAWMSAGPMGFSRSGGVNAGLSQWTKKKAFELNMEIGVALAVGRGSPPGSYDKKMVHFSFWKLPKSNYAPRVADDRIGYFLTANQDWAKPTESRDLFNRYIDRWHLEKRDPSLSMCEPKQPIIYYIEKTVPVKFRRAVRDGILEWNKAYEKVGFVNAVEVRQQTHDNEWKDLDPEDMRYSFFRWIVTGAGFAMGPHRANPFTGQIYDADIIFDDSMVRYYQKDAELNLTEAAMANKMSDPVLREFFEKNPKWKRPRRSWEQMTHDDHEEDAALRDAMRERMQRRGHVGCDYHEGMKHQMAVAHAMMAGQPKEAIDKLLYDVIKEVVMHEVGHTLGLRHNFKASTIFSVDEIKQRRGTGDHLVGSVMDYNPVLFFEDKTLEGHFITPTLGPWDYWVIEYGYRPADGSYEPPAPKDEEESAPEEARTDAGAETASDAEKSEISDELLAQLPEDIRKMVKDKASQKGGNGPARKNKSNGPTFKGPNAAERKMLDAIASRAGEPQLVYATDEDTTFLGPEPRSNRFDMGRDPINWAKERITLVNKRMSTLLDWSVKDHESWYFLRASFQSLLFDKAFVLDYVGRYIGGQYTTRSHRGDPGAQPPLTLVEPEVQRRALAFIEENLFQDDFFEFPPELLNHMMTPRWSHSGARVDYVIDFPVRRIVGLLQWSNLFDRLFPNTLRRLHDNEMKTQDPGKLTVAEYIQRIQSACWTDVMAGKKVNRKTWTDATPFVSGTRRSLQREYLSMMELLVRTTPGSIVSPDIHAMLSNALRRLNAKLDNAIKTGKLDFASESHFVACKSRIDRMLELKLNEF